MDAYINPKQMKTKELPTVNIESVESLKTRNKEGKPYNLIFSYSNQQNPESVKVKRFIFI